MTEARWRVLAHHLEKSHLVSFLSQRIAALFRRVLAYLGLCPFGPWGWRSPTLSRTRRAAVVPPPSLRSPPTPCGLPGGRSIVPTGGAQASEAAFPINMMEPLGGETGL